MPTLAAVLKLQQSANRTLRDATYRYETIQSISRRQPLPDRGQLPPQRPLVEWREILPPGKPVHHIAHHLALAHRHAMIVHAPGDGSGEGVPIVLRWRARPGLALLRTC
jgi:hypothetical protein